MVKKAEQIVEFAMWSGLYLAARGLVVVTITVAPALIATQVLFAAGESLEARLRGRR